MKKKRKSETELIWITTVVSIWVTICIPTIFFKDCSPFLLKLLSSKIFHRHRVFWAKEVEEWRKWAGYTNSNWQSLPGVKSYTEVLASFFTRLGLLKRSSIQASSVVSNPPRFWYLYFAFADVTSAPEAKMCSLRISERVQLSRSKLFKLQPIVVKKWNCHLEYKQ